jgi:hypothetical protein
METGGYADDLSSDIIGLVFVPEFKLALPFSTGTNPAAIPVSTARKKCSAN